MLKFDHLLSIVFLTASTTHAAWARCDLNEVVGYTLVASKTIDGRIDNGKQEDDF